MLEKPLLVIDGVGFALSSALSNLRRSLSFRLKLLRYAMSSSSKSSSSSEPKKPRNIVIVGASMAGYTAARTIAQYLLPDSEYRIVVIEPRGHFHFTWVLPRFCVVEGHEHKAFIPFGGYLPAGSLEADGGKVAWIQDRVASVSREAVSLQSAGGEEIPYEFLIVATGAGATDSLPSRVPADDKAEGMELLREMQKRIREAKDLVVVGAGAAGVELATDAKSKYPEKRVVLVHSRDAVMHRFGPELQKAARDGITELGIELITGDRVVSEDKEKGIVMLKSGKEIVCDCLVNCTGQRPNSKLVAALSPTSISESGHILTKPTLQILDDSLPNIYCCGDVSENNTAHPNSRSAMRQAKIVGYNVVSATEGEKPREKYIPHWTDGGIKLTLGLDKSVANLGGAKAGFVIPTKEKNIALMSAGAWHKLGAKPFEDTGSEFLAKIKAKI
ncbi:FAD/NAD(P)-binding domain-containing protein [Annulohypoxylon truncatum]|uniref:FAD/NAD(P)-binding domain-containing protein n=1 Tax=Annulohypoxylon truncatum TaxID=327061 RepID=UPI0020086227|nr:FAD/NAD(P)-binding domain-containing protein [Annulohypoxylon truncatum]KAI1204945.1 FAD/NAD(P)-binding domain-containing protein [Annulohypoxylon truncatum]